MVLERLSAASVPVSVRVYVPAEELVVVLLAVALVPPPLPHPLAASVKDTRSRIAPNAAQRRRRKPGIHNRTSDARVTPEAARVNTCAVPENRPPELSGAAAARLLPVAVQVASEVLTMTLPFVTAPLELTLGFVYVKQALLREPGAETLRATEPVNPPIGVTYAS